MTWQYIPSWVPSLIMIGLTHSSIAVDIIGKLLAGAVEAMFTYLLKDTTVDANKKSRFDRIKCK